MKKLLYIMVILFIALAIKSQCIIDVEKEINNIIGTCILYRELDNRGASEIRMVLNKGSYSIYLLKPSHDISKYKLLNRVKGFEVPLIADKKAGEYIKYTVTGDHTEEFQFIIYADIEEKACIILAVYIEEDQQEEILKYAKSKAYTPLGMVRIDENIFFDITEIRNSDWREYTTWNKNKFGKASKEYLTLLPDTSVWEEAWSFCEPMTRFYNWHPAYANYPVVGISHKQVVKYCKWRSERLNESLYLENKKKGYKINYKNEEIPVVYQFRLPTKSEWEKVASIDFSEKDKKKIAKNGCHTANLKYGSAADGLLITGPVKSYYPNKIGVYNMIGNVAEMVAEIGIAKGGSWYHSEDEMSIKNDMKYDKPLMWLGFRCICEKVNSQ